MKIKATCYVGKGGVGKTVCAVGDALLRSVDRTMAIIDYDGGHAVLETMGLSADSVKPNRFLSVSENLMVGVVEGLEYIDIATTQKKGWSLDQYFLQFPGVCGFLPLYDILSREFGIVTDVHSLRKFAVLANMLAELERQEVRDVVIDVEPTAGLESLLNHMNLLVQSLRDTKERGTVALGFIKTMWPSIGAYLKTAFVRDLDTYDRQLHEVINVIRGATYRVVSIPEMTPAGQALSVIDLVNRFGGKVSGVVVNNVRGESHEERAIGILRRTRLPMAQIRRSPGLHALGDRAGALRKIGKELSLLA